MFSGRDAGRPHEEDCVVVHKFSKVSIVAL
jgi:hypothetical protein